jgi:hypothetical protein
MLIPPRTFGAGEASAHFSPRGRFLRSALHGVDFRLAEPCTERCMAERVGPPTPYGLRRLKFAPGGLPSEALA